MAYWLVKSEPDSWSWDEQVKAGAKGTPWTGGRNHAAKLNLNVGKEIVGIVEVAKEHYPDPTDKTAKFVCVDFKAVEPLKTPVTLEAIKKDKKLAEMALIKLSRLSVQPVTADEWKIVSKMGGV
jgi:predicted RNA-binding protein with PUA-like domain